MEFTLFWMDGESEVIEGDDITTAYYAAGLGGGSHRALDFWSHGDVRDKYVWVNGSWRTSEILKILDPGSLTVDEMKTKLHDFYNEFKKMEGEK